MFGSIFTTLIVQPIFNLLVFINAIIPGHNFGLAVIIFTVLIRLAMWPLVKKQLHHSKAIRELQPEIKKIKQQSGGDRRKESQLLMELYKEREVNPLSSLGVLLLQLPILFGLFAGLRKLIDDPNQLINFSYSWMHHFGWMQTIAGDIHRFDSTLLGFIDLKRTASEASGIYWPAFILVVVSAAMQYVQSKQLMPQSKDAKSLREVLRSGSKGAQPDQQEVTEAASRSMLFLFPLLIFLAGIHFAAALSLYMLVSSLVAYIQQTKILNEDVEEESKIKVTYSKASEQPEKKPKQKKSKPRSKNRRRRR